MQPTTMETPMQSRHGNRHKSLGRDELIRRQMTLPSMQPTTPLRGSTTAPRMGGGTLVGVDVFDQELWTTSVFALLVFVSSMLVTERRPGSPHDVRVMSWNVWGIPYVSDDVEGRMERIVDAIAEHSTLT